MSRLCATLVSVTALSACLRVDGTNSGNGDFAFPEDLSFGQFHHHHHHHPQFHHGHGVDGEDRFAVVEGGGEGRGPEVKDKSRQIPLDYIQNLNAYNVSDLLLHFVEDGAPEVKNRFEDDDAEERSAATTPKGADCMPEFRTVKIAASQDPSVLYIPQCTRVEQCGGCCKHDLLSCQPLKKESVPFKVYKTQYTGDKKLKFLGTELVMVEKHTKCKCQCRKKKEDCSAYQEYHESECGCVCVNFDEKKKCLKHNNTKLWNPELCTCQCRDEIQCSTGSYFDQNDCKCVMLPANRRPSSIQKRNFWSEH